MFWFYLGMSKIRENSIWNIKHVFESWKSVGIFIYSFACALSCSKKYLRSPEKNVQFLKCLKNSYSLVNTETANKTFKFSESSTVLF